MTPRELASKIAAGEAYVDADAIEVAIAYLNTERILEEYLALDEAAEESTA